MRWKKNNDNNNEYSNLPPLFVHVSEENCLVKSNLDTIEIPINGYSLPITFNFANCIPVGDVKYTLSVTKPALKFIVNG
jgi:hypothetical protein